MLHYNKIYEITQTKEFSKWISKQELVIRTVIYARLKRVRDIGELGEIKNLGKKLFEFKWKNGVRIYFVIRENKTIVLLNGGNKSGQKRDIKKARTLQKSYDL